MQRRFKAKFCVVLIIQSSFKGGIVRAFQTATTDRAVIMPPFSSRHFVIGSVASYLAMPRNTPDSCRALTSMQGKSEGANA
jgi:hypothetical protein